MDGRDRRELLDLIRIVMAERDRGAWMLGILWGIALAATIIFSISGPKDIAATWNAALLVLCALFIRAVPG